MLAVITGDHGHARQATFSGFGLEHNRQLSPDTKSEGISQVQSRFPIPRKGSSIHS
ncbi:hypothetical protein ALP15_101940 [Pseudomonas savastanoi]|uniref:Uncharacterized protein n=1 Tax=Pseudomonas savastanoi TaxID=29438 RepID=A0A3M6A8E4_PSESS|nr:hypothetical protein ALP15_101940 [Pseudomonas savastanoi]